MLCKSASTAELYSWTPQIPFETHRGDNELLHLRGRLLRSADTGAFRVSDGKQSQDFARYSDRYADAPAEPFHKSKLMSIQPGVHFAQELLPSSGAKRSRGGGASSSKLKRLRKNAGSSIGDHLDEEDEEAGEDDDDEEGGGKSGKRNDDDEEAAPTDEEYSEEEDILDDGGGFDGWEDGGDDQDDDGGDNEPEY